MSKDGGPAFPTSLAPDGAFGGMSLRDWFAGQALAGITGQSEVFLKALCLKANEQGVESEEYTAQMAYALADVMLAQRSAVAPIIENQDQQLPS